MCAFHLEIMLLFGGRFLTARHCNELLFPWHWSIEILSRTAGFSLGFLKINSKRSFLASPH